MIKVLPLAFLALSLHAHAAVIGFDPSVIAVEEGKTFEVAVRGSGFDTGLDGGGFDLSIQFPAIVRVLDVVLDEDTWDPDLSDPGDISDSGDAVTGTSFARSPAPVGAFPILVYRLIAEGVGTSNLTLIANSDFVSGLDTVEVEFRPGTVHVIPEPAAAWMLIAGLALLWLLRRVRST